MTESVGIFARPESREFPERVIEKGGGHAEYGKQERGRLCIPIADYTNGGYELYGDCGHEKERSCGQPRGMGLL